MSAHNYQQTSLLALESIKDGLGSRQSDVLEVIEKTENQGICNREIADYLRWPINTVTPRVKELRTKGLVEAAQIGTDPLTGRRVIFWKAVR